MRLSIQKFQTEGLLFNKYKPLMNIINDKGEITEFRIKNFLDSTSTVNIDCQPSYDGTVNLILNNDKISPALINTRFTKIEDNKFKVITRNQSKQTNLYDENSTVEQSKLFFTTSIFPKIDLKSVSNNGQLMGGNYTFYIRYADADDNESDIVSESGQVSIFHGNLSEIRTIYGTLLDERTNKSIILTINNLDTSFSHIYLYYSRSTSDINGVRFDKYYKVVKPYEIFEKNTEIILSGFEEAIEISEEELNIQYNIVDAVKTQTQVQNRLFFGNVSKTMENVTNLATISQYIQVSLNQSENEVGNVSGTYDNLSTINNLEYYSPKNIFYFTGYWPDEIYRLGVVYILNNGTKTDVYNLRGCKFDSINSSNFNYCQYNSRSENGYELDSSGYCFNVETGRVIYKDVNEERIENGETVTILVRKYLTSNGTYVNTPPVKETIITNSEIVSKKYNLYSSAKKDAFNLIEKSTILPNLTNTIGVFKNPNVGVLTSDEVKPLYYKIEISADITDALKKEGVIGLMFVRQKRIPNILCQGLSIGIHPEGYIPMPYADNYYWAESFLNLVDENYKTETKDNKKRIYYQNRGKLQSSFIKFELSYPHYSALLSVDANLSPTLQSTFDGSILNLEPVAKFSMAVDQNKYDGKLGSFTYKSIDTNIDKTNISTNILFVDEYNTSKMLDDKAFCTKAGSAEIVSDFVFLSENSPADKNWTKAKNATKDTDILTRYTSPVPDITRGIYCSILGTPIKLNPSYLYNIKRIKYTDSNLEEYFRIRGNDKSPFFAISNIYSLTELETNKTPIDVYRGDCYSNVVTIRINRNFTDPEVPITDTIIDDETWTKYYKGFNDADTDYAQINRADVNSVPLGMWVTYKCLSSNNLGLRAIDRTYTDEIALIGNPRSFYPVTPRSTRSAYKLSESALLNKGYSATVGCIRNFEIADVPYLKTEFDNRIMFSNTQVYDNFKNGYRVFQGLSYKDIDRQYGAIVKLEPWGSDLLCVFEHGIAIVPINQKALFKTTTGDSIHLYGSEVLSRDVSPISEDFGSIWGDSVIKTPMGVYGVDTTAKKIWRVNSGSTGSGAIEIISDMKVQKFLNDNIKLSEFDTKQILAIKNVKTHYNNFKGDVMFTFYNKDTDTSWNLCYNERLGKWVTEFSWLPIFSSNINNIYYSIDQKRNHLLATIWKNQTNTHGLKVAEGDSEIALYNRITLSEATPVIPDVALASEVIEYKNYGCDIGSATVSLEGYDTDETELFVHSIETSYVKDGQEYFIKCDDYPYKTSIDEEDPEPEDVDPNNAIAGLVTFFKDKSAAKWTVSFIPDNLIEWFTKETKFESPTIPLYVKLTVSAKIYKSFTIDGKVVKAESPIVIKDVLAFRFKPYEDSNLVPPEVYQYWIEDSGVYKNRVLTNKDNLLRSGIYVHGTAGLFDEINYEDNDMTNQILPTKWYDRQEPFEFEFIINGKSKGMQKIFDNLAIISNNVQPDEFEFEIVGDSYQFNKEGTFKNIRFGEDEFTYAPTKLIKDTKVTTSQDFHNCKVLWDTNTNTYAIRMTQPCINMAKQGRLLGNIQYKEDCWYLTIDPIKFNRTYKVEGQDEVVKGPNTSARLRDKYVKVRVKYSGKDLAIITGIKSIYTLSYS